MKDLKVEGDLLTLVSHDSEGHVLEELRVCHHNIKSHSQDMLVKWRGLDDSDNTWHPVPQLKEDVSAGVCIASPGRPRNERHPQRSE